MRATRDRVECAGELEQGDVEVEERLVDRVVVTRQLTLLVQPVAGPRSAVEPA